MWLNVKCALHTRALGTGAFLRVMRPADPRVPHVENPVQRVAEARELFQDLLSCLEPLAMTCSMAAFTMPILMRGGGFRSLAILGASFTVFGVCQALAPDWKKITNDINKMEMRFQVLHTRLRHVAEPVAFSGGGGAERRIVEAQFDAICAHRKQILYKEFLHKWLSSLLTSYDMIPIIVQRSISYNFSLLNNPSFAYPG